MKTRFEFDNGISTIILTPETKAEKAIVNTISMHNIDINAHRKEINPSELVVQGDSATTAIVLTLTER